MITNLKKVSVNSIVTSLTGLLLVAAWQVHAAPQPANPTLQHVSQQTTPMRNSSVIAPVEPRYQPPTPVTSPQQMSPQTLSISAMAEPLATCDVSGYGQKSGQALVDHILLSETNCINDLYDGNSNSFASFTSQKMVTVADAARQMGQDYSASNDDSSINKLFYFLRTGYFIEYYYPDELTFNNSVQGAVVEALDSFTSNPDFYSASSSHGQAIQDAIVLIDSAGENARYLPVVKSWLDNWDQNAASISNMRSSVNGIFTVLFRGHYIQEFIDTAGSDTALMQSLGAFARSDWMLDSSALFMQENAGRELARFLQHESAPAYAGVKYGVQQVLDHYSMTGTGSSVWLATAGNAEYYGDCSDFGICGFAEDLEQEVLADRHTCSSSLRIHAQDMNSIEMSDSCSQLSEQETYFHQLLATNYNPVADDLNTDLEVVVFDDWDEYNTYAPLFYGIDTDNGGMYLEGDPASAGNQARFIAHEADWLRPDFEVWNLTHEYVHYLDGRYNLYGGFGDARTGSHKTVWWIEGLAEYVSKQDYNDTAIDLARTGEFNLSEIFANTYSSGQDRVYRWGYLAVRFMFEEHYSEVVQLLTYLRAGDYDAYLNYIDNIGTSYDSQWQSWLQQVESTTDGGDNGGDDTPAPLTNNVEVSGIAVDTAGDDLHFYIDVPANAESLSVAISDGSGDADLYIRHGSEATDTEYACRPYIGGNTEVCDIENPQEGRWYVRLKAYQAFSNVSLLPSFVAGSSLTCSGTPVSYGNLELGANTCISDGSGLNYYYTFLPEGTNSLTVKLFGGEGNADLYLNDATWATESDYDQRAINSGNDETLTITTPESGWYYISVVASEPYSGVGIQLIAN